MVLSFAQTILGSAFSHNIASYTLSSNTFIHFNDHTLMCLVLHFQIVFLPVIMALGKPQRFMGLSLLFLFPWKWTSDHRNIVRYWWLIAVADFWILFACGVIILVTPAHCVVHGSQLKHLRLFLGLEAS